MLWFMRKKFVGSYLSSGRRGGRNSRRKLHARWPLPRRKHNFRRSWISETASWHSSTLASIECFFPNRRDFPSSTKPSNCKSFADGERQYRRRRRVSQPHASVRERERNYMEKDSCPCTRQASQSLRRSSYLRSLISHTSAGQAERTDRTGFASEHS